MTGDVETVKLADVEPAGTVTLAGTPAAELSLDKVTTEPLGLGAGLPNPTVPCEGAPAATAVGVTEIEIDGGVTVSVTLLVMPA